MLQEIVEVSGNHDVPVTLIKANYSPFKEYAIPPENIYNADEKGIQLGVGKSVAAIVDRNQKNVQQVEDGNREMVTIIETVCADGTALPPSVIFQGKRRVLEWGKDNPCDAR